MSNKNLIHPLNVLREAIADALWSAVSAPELPSACVALGLKEGDSSEAMNSKRKYVRSRIMMLKKPELVTLASRIIEEYNVPDLADVFGELTIHEEYRITDLTRRSLLAELNSAGELFGDLSIWDGIEVLIPDLEKPSFNTDHFTATLRDDIQLHYVENNDISNYRLLELCGALTSSQQRFFDLLEKVVDPICRRGPDQERLVNALSKLLNADGFTLTFIGEVSRHPQYRVMRVSPGVDGSPKNLIFASVNCKPDLYLADAIGNDIAIANNSDALIYGRPLSAGGLLWTSLAKWWMDREKSDNLTVANRTLYARLSQAVSSANSPGELAIFKVYYSHFQKLMGDRLPALIPQVYLHYDPKSVAERGKKRVLVRQRMDFLLLLEHGVRVVIEVDGQHHFANAGIASPAKYAEMAMEDRRLSLQGYEVYRFGAAEFADVQRLEDGRYIIGSSSTELIVTFFDKLFARHCVDHSIS